MNRTDTMTALKIARAALEHSESSNRVGYELGLSAAELDNIYKLIDSHIEEKRQEEIEARRMNALNKKLKRGEISQKHYDFLTYSFEK
jgi:hypothetical protein